MSMTNEPTTTTTTPAADPAAAAATATGEPGVTYVKVDLPPVPPEMLKTTRVYEVLLIIEAQDAKIHWDKTLETVKSLIEARHGGLILKVEEWANSRKLAYEVKGLRRGTYMLVFFRAKPSIINTLDHELRFDEKVIRHLIVQHEKMPDALTGRVRIRVADEFEDEDFGRGRRDDDWGDDDYGYDDE
jgi:small subunit ribosomal protein S6